MLFCSKPKLDIFVYYNIFLIIKAAPSQPTGPLEVKDITETTATIAWLPSTDDGGSPITGYKIQISEEGSDWSDLDTVDKSAKKYNVKDLKEGKNYLIRVLAVNKMGTSRPLESDVITPKKPAGMCVCNTPYLLTTCIYPLTFNSDNYFFWSK